MPPKAGVRRRLACNNCKKAKRKCDEKFPCQLCISKGLQCTGPQSMFQVTGAYQPKTEPRKDGARSTFKMEENAEADEPVGVLPEHALRRNVNEECSALGRGPSITWTDVANQSFMPRAMQRSRTSGLLLPWQLVLEGQSRTNLLALNAIINAAALQSLAREAPEDAKARLVAEGAGQYGRSLVLVNAMLQQEDKAVSNAAIISVMGLAAYGLGARVRFREHVAGIREMLRLRGPSLLQDEASRSILKAFRDRSIFAGICQHGDLPFNRQDHPWFFAELGNSHFDRLQLIAISLPAALRQYMLLAGSDAPPREDHEHLVMDTYAILADLRSWHARLPEPLRAITGAEASSTSKMIKWYRVCEIICMVMLTRSLSYLSATAPDLSVQEQHDVEISLMAREIRESLQALGMTFQSIPQQDVAALEQERLSALAAYAPSKYLLHTLLTAASIADPNLELRARLSARADDLLSTDNVPTTIPDNVQSPHDLSAVKSTYKPVWFTGRNVPLDLKCLENLTGLPQCCY